MTTATECAICVEKFNKSNHKQVVCGYCEFDACRECCKTYMLSSPAAKCMNPKCEGEWSLDFIVENFTKKFVSTDLKKHKEDLLFDQERALLPETQLIIEKRNKIKSLIQMVTDMDEKHKRLKQSEDYVEKTNEIYLKYYPDVIQKRMELATAISKLDKRHPLKGSLAYYDIGRFDRYNVPGQDNSEYWIGQVKGRLVSFNTYHANITTHDLQITRNGGNRLLCNCMFNSHTTSQIMSMIQNSIKEVDRYIDMCDENREKNDKYPIDITIDILCRDIRRLLYYDYIRMLDIKVKTRKLSIEMFYEINTRIVAIEQEYITIASDFNAKHVKSNFVKSCSKQGCRGFLSSDWKCGLCEEWTCPDCHLHKGPEKDCVHVCNPDDVATATLLSKDSKNCPGCQEGIFKIDGCDQMWCTSCHTAFSWTTGAIEKKIHNPHYYEYMRKNGGLARDPNDVVCGNDLDQNTAMLIHSEMVNRHPKTFENQTYRDIVDLSVRGTLHISEVERPKYEIRAVDNTELRVAYLTNLITEEQFKTTLQRDVKKNNKKREIFQVLDLYVRSMTDILFRYYEMLKKAEPDHCDNEILDEINTLVQYVNECFKRIGNNYSSVVKFIDPDTMMLV